MSDYEPKCKKTLPIIFDDRMPVNNLTPKLVGRVNDNTEDLKNLYEETDTMQGDIDSLQDDVDGKLNVPETAGTSGQVLTSDGEGGVIWASVGSGEIVVDPTLTVEGAAADAKKTGDEITHLKQDISELQDGKADASGTSENLTAGNAEQLLTDKGVTDKVPYLFRTSGGNGADREQDKIVGGTVAWNQFVKNGNFESTSGWNTWHSTLSVENNVATVTNSDGSTSAAINKTLFDSLVKDHKYLVSFDVKQSDGKAVSYYLTNSGSKTNYTPTANVWHKVCGVKNCTSSTNDAIIYLYPPTSEGDVAQFKNVNIFDLTQMFGTAIADRAYAMEVSTAGSGIAWLRSMGFFQKDYYPYDAGTLKSVEGLTAHSMVGFNQWDEEWEVGGINHSTGENTSASTVIRFKNYMPCLGNTTYFLRMNSGTDINAYVHYYNSDKAFISYVQVSANNTFTTPINARYIRINASAAYGTTYKNDICINLSDPAKNGTYEPYTKHSYPLDSSWIGRGVLKLDSNYQIYYDGDEYYSSGKTKTRYGIVDLGTVNWTSGYNGFYNNSALTSLMNWNSAQVTQRALCEKYIWSAYSSRYDKTISFEPSSHAMIVFDSAYSDAATFKAAMSGVYLVYELATASTEEADPYQNPQILDPYGTEEYETTGIVPVGHETFYPENLRKKIEGLPFNFATLIAPTETTYTATRAYSANNLFIVDNILYKATTSIASGGTITPGTNCTATTLAEIIAALS